MPKVELIRDSYAEIAWSRAYVFICSTGILRVNRVDISSEGTDTLISIYYTED